MSLQTLLSLQGRRALVTGASRGLGLQIAQGLCEQGAAVVLHARPQDADELAAAAQALRAAGATDVRLWVHDLLDIDGIAESLAAIEDPIDILVNNAGASWAEPAESHGRAAWTRLMDLNLNAVFVLTQEVGRRWMIPRRGGKILNIASVAGLRGNPPALQMQTLAYNTSKGGLVNFTRALAVEWGRFGINVNAICPGFFPSRLTVDMLARASAEIAVLTPLGRVGTEEDLKGLSVVLCSDAGRHISGQAIAVDGGLSAA